MLYAEEDGTQRFATSIRQLGRNTFFRRDGLATNVEQFEETAESGLLDTWLQFGAEESLDRILAELNIQSDTPEDDIVSEILRVDSKLITLYEAHAGETSSPHGEELLEGLAQMQEARERQLARAAR